MDISVKRDQEGSAPECTLGKLYINGKYFCETLEDPVREVEGKPVEEWKIPAITAIPRGTYRIKINFSNRFKRNLPLLIDVPGFEGIRIHPGNWAKNTEGCIIVGRTRGIAKKSVHKSVEAFDALFDKIYDALKIGEQVWITIS